MSSWSRFIPGSNRWSPWGGQAQDAPSYYASDSDRDHYERERHIASSRHADPYSNQAPTRSHRRADSPSPPRRQRRVTAHDHDTLVLSYKGRLYPLHFQPYDIDDGYLKIGHIRAEGSRAIGTISPDAMKMFVKGKKLDDNEALCRDMGFRSKVPERILVTEAAGRPLAMPGTPTETASSDNAVEDDSGDSDEGAQAGAAAPGKKRNRNKKKKKKSKNAQASATTSAPLPYPTGGVEHLPMPTSSHPMHRMPSPSQPSTTKSANGTATPPTKAPTTPMGKLDSIAATFHTTLLPKCHTFLENPPADKEKRRQEAGKLSLTIEQNIVLKYDGVETEGDDEVRLRRKALIKEAQGWLGRLDKAVEQP